MTTSVSFIVGSNADKAGRSMPGMVRKASLAIAISAPVLPALTAALTSPDFTALTAIPMDVVLELRSACPGLSSPDTTSGACRISDAALRLG